MIENTSKRDPMLHLLGALSDGTGGYIEGMEAAGGRQFQADAELMPARGPWDDLVALGFAKPEPTDDELFVRTRLPKGWTKRSLEDPRGGEILDERGLPRVGTFYKAAPYDRKADCHVIAVGHALATRDIYGDAQPTEPSYWVAMTAAERADYIASLDGYLQRAEEYPDIYGDRAPRVRQLKAATN